MAAGDTPAEAPALGFEKILIPVASPPLPSPPLLGLWLGRSRRKSEIKVAGASRPWGSPPRAGAGQQKSVQGVREAQPLLIPTGAPASEGRLRPGPCKPLHPALPRHRTPPPHSCLDAPGRKLQNQDASQLLLPVSLCWDRAGMTWAHGDPRHARRRGLSPERSPQPPGNWLQGAGDLERLVGRPLAPGGAPPPRAGRRVRGRKGGCPWSSAWPTIPVPSLGQGLDSRLWEASEPGLPPRGRRGHTVTGLAQPGAPPA